jgi:hypothetical protein
MTLGGPTAEQRSFAKQTAVSWRLLDTGRRAGVWPDSVQVLGGTLSKRLPTSVTGVALHRFAARRAL